MAKKEKRDYPGSQPFNINGRKNLYKRNAWWQNSPYHNNSVRKARDD